MVSVSAMTCSVIDAWAKRARRCGIRVALHGAAFSDVLIGSNTLSMDSAKGHAIEGIQQLPDDVSYEDIMERLLFIQKVELGLREVHEGRIKSHEEARERLVTVFHGSRSL